jgi:hypothetical protein
MVLAVAVLALTATVAAACGSSPGPTTAPTSTTVVYGTGDLAQVYCTPTGIGTQKACGGLVPAPAGVTDRIALDRTSVHSGTVIHGTLIVENRSGHRIALLDPHGCQPSMAIALTSATMAPVVGFSAVCIGRPLVLHTGANRFSTDVVTTALGCIPGTASDASASVPVCLPGGGPPPLATGTYHAVLVGRGLALPPASVRVTLSRAG